MAHLSGNPAVNTLANTLLHIVAALYALRGLQLVILI